ncbi:MAG: inorganic phosphate transporter, partial [Ignavibacteriales bacterium]|nr:inorganic phosphate transporter [Ignavibacteriales bacterium]
MFTLILVIIFIALIFDFLNGFHDAANSIATIVSTRVLTPRKAVMWAAFFNLVAAFMFDVHVAKTIGKGLIDLSLIAPGHYVIMSGLIGAIVWNIITWYYGIPTSSSHALIGGYAGAAMAKAGLGVILFSGWIKTLIFIVIAPFMGMIMGFVLMAGLMWIFHDRPSSKINSMFRKLQLVSAALYSLGHGTNDAQKTMGIITGLLITVTASNAIDLPSFLHLREFNVPLWVILLSHFAIAMGTLFGGWRIVKTMGQ